MEVGTVQALQPQLWNQIQCAALIPRALYSTFMCIDDRASLVTVRGKLETAKHPDGWQFYRFVVEEAIKSEHTERLSVFCKQGPRLIENVSPPDLKLPLQPLPDLFSTNSEDSDPAKCNEKLRGFFDAPQEFVQKYLEQCPPEQVGMLNDQPIYASRPGLEPVLERSELPAVPPALVISPTGTVAQASLALSSGDKQMDSIALSAVKNWLFRPATWNGKAVAVRTNLIVPFNRLSRGDSLPHSGSIDAA